MPERKFMTGNEAVARAILLSEPEVIGNFPITPQTGIMEYLAKLVDQGKLKAKYLLVESEMSAAAVVNGASRAGARVSTATSSQGLLLMGEQIFSAGLRRLPIVMPNVNRTLGPSWNILCSREDSLILRDWPWMQVYVSTAQEALDSVIQAYKIAEDRRVKLPIMICLDGFLLSHSSELAEIPDQELVRQYLGKYNPEFKLDPDNPRVFEPSIDDTVTTEFRYNLMRALNEAAPEVIAEAHKGFSRLFSREYGFTEQYNINKNTKLVLVAMGTEAETIKAVIGQRKDKDVGLLRIRVFRPLPNWEIFDTLQTIPKVAVLDRDMQRILWQEVKSCFSRTDNIQGYVCGMGGRDITPETIEDIIKESEKPNYQVWIDLKATDKTAEYQAPQIIIPKTEQASEELISPGHNACQGCGGVLCLKYVLEALGKNTVISWPANCGSVWNGRYPSCAVRVPVQNVCFEVSAAEAAGMAAAFEIMGKKITVVALPGDGGAYDIGFQAISGAVERGDEILIVVIDNEAYMNTGIQRSSATPPGAWTTTTPTMKLQRRKDMMAIMAAHRIPYAATASIAFPEDMIRKVRKAAEIKGAKYIDVFSSCPPGWRHDPGLSIKIARLAVTSRVWPLYEIEDGERYAINKMPKQIPVEEYLKLQGRFQNLTPELTVEIQKSADKDLSRLIKLATL